MTKQELRNAFYDEFVAKYYQSNLCQIADNVNYSLSQAGELRIEDDVFEMLEDLADSTMKVMVKNNVLTAKKQECKI